MPWRSRPVVLNQTQRDELKLIANDPNASEQEKCRALIVLLMGQGLKNKEIARRLNIHENTVVKWRKRWTGDNDNAKVTDYGLLTGRPRSAAIPTHLNRIEDVINTPPPEGATRWTIRSIAKVLDLPIATVHRAIKDLKVDLITYNKNLNKKQER